MKYSSLTAALSGAGLPAPEGIRPQGFTRWGHNNRFWLTRKANGYVFGDHATGVKSHWFPNSINVTKLCTSMAAERKLKDTKHRETADKVSRFWEKLPDANLQHPYLTARQVGAFGLRQYKNMLVIPLRDADRKLWTVQYIHIDGTKRFYTGGRKQRCFHQIGRTTDPMQPLLFAEGYATAATLHILTSLPVIMTVDAGNIEHVVRSLRKKYPLRRFVITADNDQWSMANTGKLKAEHTAKLFNCSVVLPQFHLCIDDAREFKPTDWNDLAFFEGADQVIQQISPYIS